MDRDFGHTGRSSSPSQHGLGGGGLGSSRSQGGSQVLGMTGGTSMRAQLDSISMTVHEVVGRIELSGRQILMLEEDRDRLKSVLATQDEILNQKINTECSGVRDDTNHKLALQVAENKRMQALLAKATEDCARLTRLCENLSVRVQILEAHTGVNH